MNRLLNLTVASALSALMLGCAQSSDETTDNGSSNIKTGQFIDAAVQGCAFKTPTQSGTTNAKGEFTYLDGESVEFFLGDFKLGSVKGGTIVTPLGLVTGSEPTNQKEVLATLTPQQQTKVNNLLRLLQSVDKDGNSSNGVDLSHITQKSFPELQDKTFDDEAALSLIVDTIAPGTPIKTQEEALAHFTGELDTLEDIDDKNESNPVPTEVEYTLVTTAYDNNLSGTWALSIIKQSDGTLLVDDINTSAQFVPTTTDALIVSEALQYIEVPFDDVNISLTTNSASKKQFLLTAQNSTAPLSFVITFTKLSPFEKEYIGTETQIARSVFIKRTHSSSYQSCGPLPSSIEYSYTESLYNINSIDADIESAKAAFAAAFSIEKYGYTYHANGSGNSRLPFLFTHEVHSPALLDNNCYASSRTTTIRTLFKYDDYSNYIINLAKGLTLSGTWNLKQIVSLPGGGSLPTVRETSIAAADVPLSVSAITAYGNMTLKDGTYWIPKKSVTLRSDLVKWSVYHYGAVVQGILKPTIYEFTFTKEQ